MEIWDAYLEDGALAGCDLIRGSQIPFGLFHLVCEVIVRHKDGSYLLMQRDYNKINFQDYMRLVQEEAHLKEKLLLKLLKES